MVGVLSLRSSFCCLRLYCPNLRRCREIADDIGVRQAHASMLERFGSDCALLGCLRASGFALDGVCGRRGGIDVFGRSGGRCWCS
jgi:hypothetical protein